MKNVKLRSMVHAPSNSQKNKWLEVPVDIICTTIDIS